MEAGTTLSAWASGSRRTRSGRRATVTEVPAPLAATAVRTRARPHATSWPPRARAGRRLVLPMKLATKTVAGAGGRAGGGAGGRGRGGGVGGGRGGGGPGGAGAREAPGASSEGTDTTT